MKTVRGFTLIELLTAMVIFSFISIAALASVNHMLRAREQQLAHHAINQALDQAYAHLFQDMMWFVGDIQADQHELQFIRTQTSHEEGIILVHYQLTEGKLFRLLEEETGTKAMLLLDKVENIRLSWLSSNQQWVGAFDQRGMDSLPLLFRLQFKTAHIGEVTWVFALPHL